MAHGQRVLAIEKEGGTGRHCLIKFMNLGLAEGQSGEAAKKYVFPQITQIDLENLRNLCNLWIHAAH